MITIIFDQSRTPIATTNMPATLKRRYALLQSSHVVYQAYSRDCFLFWKAMRSLMIRDTHGINAIGSTVIHHKIREIEV